MIEVISERLTMTPLTESDWLFFQSLYTDPQVLTFCGDQPSEDVIQEKFRSRLLPWSPETNNWLWLLITEKQTGQQIGITGFLLENGVAKVGYLLAVKHHGKQFGTESLAALLQWAKTQGINQFKAVVTQGDIASERVLMKCGFKLTTIEPDAFEIGGKLYADHHYQLSL